MAGADRRGAEAIGLAPESTGYRSGASSRDYHNHSRSEGPVTGKINVYGLMRCEPVGQRSPPWALETACSSTQRPREQMECGGGVSTAQTNKR